MAGSKVLYEQQFVQVPSSVNLRFRLQFVTNAAPDFQLPAGSIASVTKVGGANTGVYSMTLNEWYPVFIGGRGLVMTAAASVATASSRYVTIDPADYVPSTGVLTFRVFVPDGNGTGAGTAADIPNDDWVFFDLCFCRRNQLTPVGAVPA